jgi:ATP phosphoribosyltransferase regulatory subunit
MGMARSLVGTPAGAQDYLFDACGRRREMEARAGALFARYGYREVMTPVVELFELFTRTGQPMPPESMVKLIDRDGRVLAMRPDSTTPVARVVAARLGGEPMPVRLYYLQDVYRDGAVHRGRRLETRQAGVEFIGAGGLKADLEVLSLAAEALSELGAGEYRVELSHAALFRGLFRALQAPPGAVEELRALIERKNFASLGDKLKTFANRPACEAILRLCHLFGGAELFEETGSLGVAEADEALGYLRNLYTALAGAGFGRHLQLDFGLVHQLEYYTGLVFRGYVSGAGRAVLTGGRYDHLMGALGRAAPGAGFVLDVDALCARVQEPPPAPRRARRLLHFPPARLREALGVVALSEQGAYELSPCATLAESLALARSRDIAAVVDLERDGVEIPVSEAPGRPAGEVTV